MTFSRESEKFSLRFRCLFRQRCCLCFFSMTIVDSTLLWPFMFQCFFAFTRKPTSFSKHSCVNVQLLWNKDTTRCCVAKWMCANFDIYSEKLCKNKLVRCCFHLVFVKDGGLNGLYKKNFLLFHKKALSFVSPSTFNKLQRNLKLEKRFHRHV